MTNIMGSIRIAAAALSLAAMPLSSSFGRNIYFTLENKTNQSIIDFWATKIDIPSWGSPFIDTYIPPGGSQGTDVRGGGCYYDMMVRFEQGKNIYWRNVNFCVNEIMIYVDGNDTVTLTSR